MKEPKKETKPTPPEVKPPPAAVRSQEPSASGQAEGEDQDPKAISESLRRIRTSGPLIIEAIKQKQERISEIIAQSIESVSGGKGENRREEPKPPKPPVQPNKQVTKQANPKTKNQPSPQTTPKPNGQSGMQATAQSIAQTAANTVAAAVAATQSAARKTSGAFSGSTATRSNTGGLANTGHLPLNGPSTVLAQASGLKPQSGFGSRMRVVLIALAVLLAAGTYFMFRDRLLTRAYVASDERNLVSPEDQSTQFIRLGEMERDRGNHEAAIEQFQRGVQLAPNNQNIRFLLAQTYLGAGQPDEALNAYLELLRIAPEHLEARFQIAGIHGLRGDWNAAYKEYQNIIEFDQNSPQAAVALEAIEKRQAEQDLQLASALSRRSRAARSKAPVLPAANPGRAQVALLSQRVATATGIKPPAAVNRLEEKPDPRAVADTHKKLGVRYLNVREFRAAINEFLQALSLTPGDKDLYYFIGSSYHGLGQYADAYDYYRRVDNGPYLGPAQSGTRQTEKAAREAYKRREAQRFDSMKNDTRNESDADKSNRPIVNTFKE